MNTSSLERAGAPQRAAVHAAATVSPLRPLAWLALTALAVHGFYGLAGLYGGFDVLQGASAKHVHPSELVFFVWYLLIGSVAAACCARAAHLSGLGGRAAALCDRVLGAPRGVAYGSAALVFASSAVFRASVLRGQPLTDDEPTYDLIAETLLQGRIVNAPPIAAEFLKNTFVIAGEQGWYGKYPIGHPLLLALGKALSAEALIVPLLGAGGVLLSYAIGRRLVGERQAALACLLLALSPHYVWTHGTQLSQPTAMVCMLGAVLALLRLLETGRPRFALLAGLALGFGILARPMPGVLFAVAALVACARELSAFSSRAAFMRALPSGLLLGLGSALGTALVLLVNYLQSGDPWTSGYHTLHGRTGLLDTRPGLIAASVAGAVLRENFWLLGWPLSFLFVPFARLPRRGFVLLAMIAAALAYRVLVPKTVVATTGPVYLLEIVPLLCLLTASGMARSADWLERALALGRERARSAIAAIAIGASAVALLAFCPVQLRSVQRAAIAYAAPYRLLAEQGVTRAVVFASMFVVPGSGVSWAHARPNPTPALDGDLVFLRMLPGDDGYQRMLELWRSRFADRRGLLLYMTPDGLALRELPLTAENPAPEKVLWTRSR